MQICTGTKRRICTAMPASMTTVSSTFLRRQRPPDSLRRRIDSRMPQRLHHPLPLPPRSPPALFSSPLRHPRPHPRSRTSLVRFRNQVVEQAGRALRTGRELLARSDMDPDELYGVGIALQGSSSRFRFLVSPHSSSLNHH